MNTGTIPINYSPTFITRFSFGLIITLLTHIMPVLSQDLGGGFYDHGVAVPISNHRGTVATTDAQGRNVVLVWLFDHRGGYGLIQIDAETGKTKQFPTPFTLDKPYGDAPYASILSTKNKYYTLFNSNFAEYDPAKAAFTFTKQSTPRMAMGMTEDEQGVIWAVTYPNSGLVSFNPDTREFKDYGSLYKQNWLQYPKSIATDDAGWVYIGLGNTASQIIAFHPATDKATPMLEETERERGSAYVYRNKNGRVYGQALQGDQNSNWLEFYKGERRKENTHNTDPVPMIAGSQTLIHRGFPDGKRLLSVNLIDRKLAIEDPTSGSKQEVQFDYESDGALVMGVGTAQNGTIVGGTAFPMRFFSFKPATNTVENVAAFDQFNALAQQGNRFYFGVYPHGYLLEWDPSKPWVNTQKDQQTNPLMLAQADHVIDRPSRVHGFSDGKTVIMSGTPGYGYTGGGLLFWDREKKTSFILPDSAIVVDQSTLSMVSLPGGKLLAGTTTMPGTGGEKKAKEAGLYIMDVASRRIDWYQAVLPGIQSYSDMCIGPDGLVYGIADWSELFVFDPVKRVIVHRQNMKEKFGNTTSAQSPRIFVRGPKNEIYILFVKGIVKLEPGTYHTTMIAESPLPINAGGDYLDGRIYFVNGSHICSYKLDQEAP